MADDKPKATTGDPKLDEIVRAHFTEAIEITRQILVDRHPEFVNDYSQEWVGTTCALIAVQTWPIFGAMFASGVSLSALGDLIPDGD